MSAPSPLLSVRELRKYFPLRRGVFGRVRGYLRAVDQVSLELARGETLGLVGESGCGKTTLGRMLLGLVAPTAGQVSFNGQELSSLSRRGWRSLRRQMQIIFQDPYSSLNPRLTVEKIVGEGLTIHGLVRNRRERRERVAELLARVGLSRDALERYPHEFSGGQRQRIGIARAIALTPAFIVCDEPVSALDISIQAQILNLLLELQEEMSLSYLFIAHNLAVVERVSDRVAVMYLGELVEAARAEELYRAPGHPYTRALVASIPVPDPGRARARAPLSGEVPSAREVIPGCRFHPRCPEAHPRCQEEVQALRKAAPEHYVRCWRAG